MRFFGNHSKKNDGITVVEMLVALSVFGIFMSLAVGGFIQSVRNQKLTLLLMEANDNISLAIEQVAREIRTGNAFNAGEDWLEFTNSDTRIRYELGEGGRIYKAESPGGGAVPPAATRRAITTSDPNIRITDFDVEMGGGTPALVTLFLRISVSYGPYRDIQTTIQTSISPRVFYNI